MKNRSEVVSESDGLAASDSPYSPGPVSERLPSLAPIRLHRAPEPAGRKLFSGNVVGDSLTMQRTVVPPPRPDLLVRPRLLQRLSAGLKRGSTLVSASAGSGKTTLLSQWAAQSGRSVAWVSLEAGDNDPERFWGAVSAAVGRHQPDLFNVAGTGSVDSTAPFSLSSLSEALVRLNSDIVLVLDQYEHIVTQSIHRDVTFLIDHRPPQLHLVICSRTDPPLSLARLRAAGQLNEIRAELRFTREEADTFLNEIMGLGLSREDLATLVERSEGWIVGLQLAAHGLQQCQSAHSKSNSEFVQDFAGDHRHIRDYFVEEVFERQPRHVQTFLLRTSILNRLNGSLGEAVTGGKGCQATLERLERANVFTVALDDECQWYRYHWLFAGFLRTRLKQMEPAMVPELHRRACNWLAENDMPGEAILHAGVVGDHRLVTKLIRQNASMIVRGEAVKLLSWFELLPDEIVRDNPYLCVVRANALMASGQIEAAETWYQKAEVWLDGLNESAVVTSGDPFREELDEVRRMLNKAMGNRAMAMVYQGSYVAWVPPQLNVTDKDSESLDTRISMSRHAGSVHWRSGDVKGAIEAMSGLDSLLQVAGYAAARVVCLSELAGLQVVQGWLHEAAKTYQRALTLLQDETISPYQHRLLGCAPCVGFAWLLYEWNDLVSANNYVKAGLKLAKQQGNELIELLGYGILARLCQAEGDMDGALDALRESDRLARSSNQNKYVARNAEYRARLNLLWGNLEDAERWAQRAGLGVNDELDYQHERDYLTLARLKLAEGKFDEAQRVLDRLLANSLAVERRGSAIKVLAVRALVSEAEGETNDALANLTIALSRAEPEGYARTFLDAGQPMASLLVKVLVALQKGRLDPQYPLSKDYMRRLLESFPTAPVPEPGFLEASTVGAEGNHRLEWSLGEPISQRELQVLQLAAAGATNQEIAERMVIEVSTVKKHLNHVFGKLEVRGRTQAIVRARSLGLLP